MTSDPVCGMTDIAPDAAATVEYEGRNYYFCSTDCQATFLAEPEHYSRVAVSDSETPKPGRLARFFGLR